MNPVLPAALIAVAIAAVALLPPPIPLLEHTPTRPHTVLGTVATLSESRPPGADWTRLHAHPLAAEARARHGRRADALINLAHEPLPNGTGARSTAVAVSWGRR